VAGREEEMNLHEFAQFLRGNVDNFEKNLKNMPDLHVWKEDWMQTFLNWAEWQTEVHELYWSKPDEGLCER
jgi:hypothetical protein